MGIRSHVLSNRRMYITASSLTAVLLVAATFQNCGRASMGTVNNGLMNASNGYSSLAGSSGDASNTASIAGGVISTVDTVVSSGTPSSTPTSSSTPSPTSATGAGSSSTTDASSMSSSHHRHHLGQAREIKNVHLTYYGYDDNDNSSQIAFPIFRRGASEDLGTYEHPTTFAGDARFRLVKPGGKIYVPRLRRYYVLEDTCSDCTRAANNGRVEILLWIGSSSQASGQALYDCENRLTASVPFSDKVIVNPPPNLPVDSTRRLKDGVCHTKFY